MLPPPRRSRRRPLRARRRPGISAPAIARWPGCRTCAWPASALRCLVLSSAPSSPRLADPAGARSGDGERPAQSASASGLVGQSSAAGSSEPVPLRRGRWSRVRDAAVRCGRAGGARPRAPWIRAQLPPGPLLVARRWSRRSRGRRSEGRGPRGRGGWRGFFADVCRELGSMTRERDASRLASRRSRPGSLEPLAVEQRNRRAACARAARSHARAPSTVDDQPQLRRLVFVLNDEVRRLNRVCSRSATGRGRDSLPSF